jgi:hypothetical protein
MEKCISEHKIATLLWVCQGLSLTVDRNERRKNRLGCGYGSIAPIDRTAIRVLIVIMNKLKDQFTLVGRLLFGTETREIFIAALQRLLAIVVETLRLGWMLFCLTFLIFVWGGAATRRAVDAIATLPERLAEQAERAELAKRQPKEKIDLVTSTKQALSAVSTNGAALAIAKAKAQLGIETDPVLLTPDTDQNRS